jgi:pimeloyl-ACP methyl ester carboxylesterase
MARFVLVHGAFAGAWLWEPVVDKLETAGHTVETLDLPGAGNDHTPVEEITLDAYAERICQVLGRRPQQAVLVGHSMGGMAVTQAASRCPERVAALIYVAAFLPGEGQSLKGLTELPEGEGDHVHRLLQRGPTEPRPLGGPRAKAPTRDPIHGRRQAERGL